MQNGDEASPNIILVGRALLVKCSYLLNRVVHMVQTLYTCVFYLCPDTGMQNNDEASPIIILVAQALLVKMLKTLGPQGIFRKNFVCLCFLTFSSHWYAKR